MSRKEQKAARTMQKETGRSYQSCLNAVRAAHLASEDIELGQHWLFHGESINRLSYDDGSHEYVVHSKASHLRDTWVMEGTGGERIYMTPMQRALGWWKRVEGDKK